MNEYVNNTAFEWIVNLSNSTLIFIAKSTFFSLYDNFYCLYTSKNSLFMYCSLIDGDINEYFFFVHASIILREK